MALERHSEFQMYKFIKIPRFYMTVMGCWPLDKEKVPTILRYLYFLYSLFIVYVVSYTFLLTLTIDFVQSFGDLALTADASYFFMTELTFLIKFAIFSYNRKGFERLLKDIDRPIFRAKSTFHDKYNYHWCRIATIYSHLFFGGCYMYWLFCAVYPLLDHNQAVALPFRGWFPFDVQKHDWNRRFVYAFQLLGLAVAIAVNASLDVLPTSFMNIGTAQMEMLKDNIENVVQRAEMQLVTFKRSNDNIKPNTPKNDELSQLESRNNDTLVTNDVDDYVYKKLIDSVEHHKAIIQFLSDVENIFNFGMFMQFLSTVIILCVTGLQLIVVPAKSLKFLTILFYLFDITFQISCYCWNGNEVILQSSSIGDVCYKMEWYRCSVHVKRLLLIIMGRCQRPIRMTAGKFFILSFGTLMTVMRTAYSYFAVLRRAYSE